MVQIVTDSNSGITPEMAKELGIAGVAPTQIIFGDKSYRDSVDLKSEQFYEMLKTTLPTTSAPSVGDFEEIFSRLKGQDVVALMISSDLSATLKACENAVAMLNGDPAVLVIDTRFVNAGEGLLVMEALNMAKAGHSAAEIKAHIEALIPRVRMNLVLETLENLKRGGRISGASAFIGGVLQMKPILAIKNGKVEPLERVRTFSKALARLKEIAVMELQGQTNPRMMILHANNGSGAQALAAEMQQTFKLNYVPMILESGPAVGTHSGPGALGLAYII
jgi:DegV family protein with EDD domain